MLRELHIANLAVIEDACIDLTEGLNAFTGQTGAGKSLIIGAFELLLGLRRAGDLLRHGATEGRVSGLFELTDPAVIQDIAATADLQLDAQAGYEQILITRKIFASGRSSVAVNGQPATTGMLKAIGELLVDVHGQHDHQYLLKPAHQILLLDRFAKTESLARQFAETWRHIGQLQEQRQTLEASAKLRRQQLELYEFQAEEIDALSPQPDEFEQLQQQYHRLANVEKIMREAGAVHTALHESDGAIIERLQMVDAVLRELAEMDAQLNEPQEQVSSAIAILQDVAFTVCRYVDRLDLDPEELGETEQRLNALNRLIHKYGSGHGANLSEVLHYRDQIDQEIRRLKSEDDDLESVDRQLAPLQRELLNLGQQLTEGRKNGIQQLIPLVEAQLAELGMAEARFDVDCQPVEPEEAGPGGFDRIEMLVQPNPGHIAKPLRQIASGGELSRIMLALKSILAQNDRISVLVFDEVDANIGGRLGSVIGRKLRDLARHHQILCITHLPQIAAFADRHMKIVKHTGRQHTQTTVSLLNHDQRIEELAEMLTGAGAVTNTTLTQARELLQTATEPVEGKTRTGKSKGGTRGKTTKRTAGRTRS